MRELAESHVAPTTRRILLADVSQSLGQDISYPEAKRVVLSEVVRCSKRIVAAASVFQLGGDAKLITQCHHDSCGPPVKSFLFDLEEDTSREKRYCQYVERLSTALAHVTSTFPGLDLQNRVAILVPDDAFLHGLRAVADPHPLFDRYSFLTASESTALLIDRQYRRATSQALVLDTLANFDGLERLIIIAVGLDAPLGQGAEDMLETRSRLYRGLTRAHMMAIVVNESIQGGWLEWLNTVRLQKDLKFDREAEMKRLNAEAAETLVKMRDSEIDHAFMLAHRISPALLRAAKAQLKARAKLTEVLVVVVPWALQRSGGHQ